jgi:hypothetical protein
MAMPSKKISAQLTMFNHVLDIYFGVPSNFIADKLLWPLAASSVDGAYRRETFLRPCASCTMEQCA